MSFPHAFSGNPGFFGTSGFPFLREWQNKNKVAAEGSLISRAWKAVLHKIMKRKTVLITGATGFLGSLITRELLVTGFNLILLIRKSKQVRARDRISEVFPSLEDTETELISGKLSDRVEIVEGDVSHKHFGLHAKDYSRLSATVDEVFHCAAATKFYHESDNMLVQTNIYGTRASGVATHGPPEHRPGS